MSKLTGFHVRHDLQPEFTYELLMLLLAQSEGQTEEELQATAHSQGYALRQRKDYSKLVKSLEELGLVEKTQKRLALSEKGQVVAEASLFQRQLLPEFVHFFYYTAFEIDENKRFSWSYRTVCDHLWTTSPSNINRDRLVNIVTQNAVDQFGETSISFSKQSVMGVLYWLEALYPPCLSSAGELFTRRLYCPIETFVLALHHVYMRCQSEGISILLTPEIRQQVCQICLIVPEAFQEMMEQAEASFDCIQIRRERGERLAIINFNWSLLKE